MNTKKALSLFALLFFMGVIFATQYKSSPSDNVKAESIEVEVNSFLSQVLIPKDKKDVLDYFGIDETNLVLVGEHNGCKFYTIKMDSTIFEEMLKPYKNKLLQETSRSILEAKIVSDENLANYKAPDSKTFVSLLDEEKSGYSYGFSNFATEHNELYLDVDIIFKECNTTLKVNHISKLKKGEGILVVRKLDNPIMKVCESQKNENFGFICIIY